VNAFNVVLVCCIKCFVPVFVDYCVLFKGMFSFIIHICIKIHS
jgi:hypothetical protein